MLKTKDEVYTKDGVGVIIGRFQVSELTDGHKSIIDSVVDRHIKTLCIVGLSEIKASKNNPLDFSSRQQMLTEAYPDIHIFYIKDAPYDGDWSRKLDSVISTHIPPDANVTLYGSRDCFVSRYHGKYGTKELVQEIFTSGTKERSSKAFHVSDSADFRSGAIWATQNQYDNTCPTVDIAIIDEKEPRRILLGRKENQTLFRFIGGHVSPKKYSGSAGFFEDNARREVQEETGVEVADFEYVGSFMVDDWRYRYEKSKIGTILYKATYVFGNPEPDDDIYELRWFNVEDFKNGQFIKDNIVGEHIPLMDHFINNFNK